MGTCIPANLIITTFHTLTHTRARRSGGAKITTAVQQCLESDCSPTASRTVLWRRRRRCQRHRKLQHGNFIWSTRRASIFPSWAWKVLWQCVFLPFFLFFSPLLLAYRAFYEVLDTEILLFEPRGQCITSVLNTSRYLWCGTFFFKFFILINSRSNSRIICSEVEKKNCSLNE